MEFRIADTFTASLDRLTNDEQKAVKLTAFDLQTNPAHPGLQFHRIERTKDKQFWSVRVSRDLRVIVHKTDASLMLCYVDHHDDAYAWAERRKLDRHPKTGAAQLVEVRERVQEIEVPRYVEPSQGVDPPAPSPPPSAPAIFADTPEEDLLGYGVPPEWIADVKAATEDRLLELADHLPAEASEALIELATGGTPAAPVHATAEEDPFEHPDAQRRFRVMTDREELERALEFPWEKWTVFLHPAQRRIVEREFLGPARVAGSAGTGKTIVALHRAVHLARQHSDARVLLATFSEPLASALRLKLRRLIGSEPRLAERLDVRSMGALAERLYTSQFGAPSFATDDQIRGFIAEAAADIEGLRFTPHFLWTEWSEVVDAWQLSDWEAYRDVRRLGRKTRLAESQRAILWKIYERVRAALDEWGLITRAAALGRLEAALRAGARPPYDYAIIDEAQDISVPELRFLASLGGERPGALFFAGDLGQRIFQQPFSWKSLGVDIRGRSATLRVNYRTSHQIRSQADRLLGPELADVDGVTEDRRSTVSVFNGPPPRVELAESEEAECALVGEQLETWIAEGLAPHELAIFVRSEAEIPRARAAAAAAGLSDAIVQASLEPKRGHLCVSPMHQAKGLEFRAVVVMACDDEVIPSQQRIESIADEADLEDVYQTERHLLYVACTRARDQLLVTAVEPGSEFLEDLGESSNGARRR